MPCNSDYLEANDYEIEMSRVLCLHEEISVGAPKNGWQHDSRWEGYHPKVYNGHIPKPEADRLVESLCTMLQSVDVSKYSLELQMWWRDHQEADRKRLEETLKWAEERNERKQVLAKLSPREKKILGIYPDQE